MVEAGRGRAGEAPVCASSARGRPIAWRISSVCFFRATRPSGGRRERSWQCPSPKVRSDRKPVRPDSRPPITSCGCSARTPARARRKRERVSATTWSRRSSGNCSPKESAASSATAGPTSCSTSAGPTRPDGRRSHRPNRRDHRRFPQRQPHRPRHRDRDLRARPTTGTIAITLSLRLDDAEAGGSSARRPTPSGAVVYSLARDALVPKAKAAALALCSLNPRCPVAWIRAARLAVDPQWRRCSCRIASRPETLANLCKNDIVVSPSDRDPPCR